MKRVLAAAAAALLLLPAAPAAADPPSTGYTLVFSDDFDGTALNTSAWNYRTDSKAYSTQRPENVSVSGGYLLAQLVLADLRRRLDDVLPDVAHRDRRVRDRLGQHAEDPQRHPHVVG